MTRSTVHLTAPFGRFYQRAPRATPAIFRRRGMRRLSFRRSASARSGMSDWPVIATLIGLGVCE